MSYITSNVALCQRELGQLSSQQGQEIFFSSTVTQNRFIGMTSQHTFNQFRMKCFVSLTTVTERLITMVKVLTMYVSQYILFMLCTEMSLVKCCPVFMKQHGKAPNTRTGIGITYPKTHTIPVSYLYALGTVSHI